VEYKFKDSFHNAPFYKPIQSLIKERLKHKKGSVYNVLFKLLGNGCYGLTAMGLNNKMKFDIKLGRSIRIEGNRISNPIIAS
jgi:hypothetical protein